MLSVVTGSAAQIGAEITSNPINRNLLFTGSTEIGRQLMAEYAKDIKDAAVAGALTSKYSNAGQACVYANRLYINDSVYNAFADKLQAAVAALRLGNGLDEGVTTGPLIDENAVLKVQE